ncbi:MAG: NYN domain-containing protein [Bdellovibrionota bacterium]
MPQRGKTIVFIDNSNIFHGCKAVGWRIDARKLGQLIEQRGPVWQTIFFASTSDPPRFKQTNFYKFLKEILHYETVILGLAQRTVRCKDCGRTRITLTEKGVDVALATRLLTLANTRTFETAVLVSGDKDYLETVKAVKSQGMRVEVYSWRGALSSELSAESSTDVIYLDNFRKDLELEQPIDRDAETLLETEG